MGGNIRSVSTHAAEARLVASGAEGTALARYAHPVAITRIHNRFGRLWVGPSLS